MPRAAAAISSRSRFRAVQSMAVCLCSTWRQTEQTPLPSKLRVSYVSGMTHFVQVFMFQSVLGLSGATHRGCHHGALAMLFIAPRRIPSDRQVFAASAGCAAASSPAQRSAARLRSHEYEKESARSCARVACRPAADDLDSRAVSPLPRPRSCQAPAKRGAACDERASHSRSAAAARSGAFRLQ